jgi:hypothetical protein
MKTVLTVVRTSIVVVESTDNDEIERALDNKDALEAFNSLRDPDGSVIVLTCNEVEDLEPDYAVVNGQFVALGTRKREDA